MTCQGSLHAFGVEGEEEKTSRACQSVKTLPSRANVRSDREDRSSLGEGSSTPSEDLQPRAPVFKKKREHEIWRTRARVLSGRVLENERKGGERKLMNCSSTDYVMGVRPYTSSSCWVLPEVLVNSTSTGMNLLLCSTAPPTSGILSHACTEKKILSKELRGRVLP